MTACLRYTLLSHGAEHNNGGRVREVKLHLVQHCYSLKTNTCARKNWIGRDQFHTQAFDCELGRVSKPGRPGRTGLAAAVVRTPPKQNERGKTRTAEHKIITSAAEGTLLLPANQSATSSTNGLRGRCI